MRARFVSILAAALTLAAVSAADANAQKKNGGGPPSTPPGQQKKKEVTPDKAVEVTQLVLKEQGYVIVRVERVEGTRVVYYRRGNNGRGRGLGPVERMVIRPSPDRVIIEAAPKSVLLQINLRLDL